MATIQRFDQSRLHNEEHFQFATDIKGLFADAFVQRSLGKIDPLWMRYQDLWRKEDIGMENIRKSVLTDPLTERDGNRDGVFYGIKEIVHANSRSIRSELVEAARKLTIVLNHYGDVAKQGYNKQTASIYNLLQEFNDNYADEVETLGLGIWVEDLETANKAVEEIMNERYDENVGEEEVNVRQTRLELDDTYNQIVDIIEASNRLNDSFGTLIERMNERIAYYKNTIATRKGRAEANKEKKNGNK